MIENPLINKIICEYPLPIPSEKFSENERVFFDCVDWSTQDFYTSSFFQEIDMDVVLSYSITEDGDFYSEKTIIEQAVDDNGEVFLKEKDGGIEKQEFTGEIIFGTEFCGDEKTNLDSKFDYVFNFKAIIFKGELKELELFDFERRDNESRKRIQERLEKYTEQEQRKSSSILYKAVHYFFVPIAWAFLIPYNLLGRFIMFLSKIESKIKSKILK
tara:strand:- start:251 stop:895 length:645 start_codon:yes stop_codon:yes gene_type:complete